MQNCGAVAISGITSLHSFLLFASFLLKVDARMKSNRVLLKGSLRSEYPFVYIPKRGDASKARSNARKKKIPWTCL